MVAMWQINLYWPIIIIQKGFDIAKNIKIKTKDAQGKNFERGVVSYRIWMTLGQERSKTICGREQNQGNRGEYKFLKVKSPNAQFDFSTNYLHFILNKAA